MPYLATLEGQSYAQHALFGASKVKRFARKAGRVTGKAIATTARVGLKVAPVVAPLLPGGAIISTGAAALTASQKNTIKKAATVAKQAVKTGALTPQEARKAVTKAIAKQAADAQKAADVGAKAVAKPQEGPNVVKEEIKKKASKLPAWAIPAGAVAVLFLMKRR